MSQQLLYTPDIMNRPDTTNHRRSPYYRDCAYGAIMTVISGVSLVTLIHIAITLTNIKNTMVDSDCISNFSNNSLFNN